jgi:hypothetical protein
MMKNFIIKMVVTLEIYELGDGLNGNYDVESGKVNYNKNGQKHGKSYISKEESTNNFKGHTYESWFAASGQYKNGFPDGMFKIASGVREEEEDSVYGYKKDDVVKFNVKFINNKMQVVSSEYTDKTAEIMEMSDAHNVELEMMHKSLREVFSRKEVSDEQIDQAVEIWQQKVMQPEAGKLKDLMNGVIVRQGVLTY